MKKKPPISNATITEKTDSKPVYHLKHKTDKEIISELLATTIQLQRRMDYLIGLVPSGDLRNAICDENINALNLIELAKE